MMGRTGTSYCAELVRRLDYDRFLCALFAPAGRRETLFALYALNAELARIRESVTEPLLGAIRLQWWRERIDALFEEKGAGPHASEVVAALASVNVGASAAKRLLRATSSKYQPSEPPAKVPPVPAF